MVGVTYKMQTQLHVWYREGVVLLRPSVSMNIVIILYITPWPSPQYIEDIKIRHEFLRWTSFKTIIKYKQTSVHRHLMGGLLHKKHISVAKRRGLYLVLLIHRTTNAP